MTLPRIALLQTGGTIDSLGTDRLDLAWYTENEQRLEPGALLAAIPEARAFAEVVEVPFRRMPSHQMRATDWIALATTLEDLLNDRGFDGAVITHGTNTLEETAYFLTLTLRTDRPVVVTGAMRPANGLSADGYLNLLNAIRLAANPAALGQGVLVLLNDTIHAARDVTKTATFRVQTFSGGDLGPLGYVDADGQVLFFHRTLKRHTTGSLFSARDLTDLPRVDLVVSYVGADGALIDAAVAAGARGIVSAGTGAGRATLLEDAALDRAARAGVVVCQSSRVGQGRVVRSPGLTQRGFVAADNLRPWKARLLLALALTRTGAPDEIQEIFQTH